MIQFCLFNVFVFCEKLLIVQSRAKNALDVFLLVGEANLKRGAQNGTPY